MALQLHGMHRGMTMFVGVRTGERCILRDVHWRWHAGNHLFMTVSTSWKVFSHVLCSSQQSQTWISTRYATIPTTITWVITLQWKMRTLRQMEDEGCWSVCRNQMVSLNGNVWMEVGAKK